jgi:hypothetical protein
MKKFKYENDGSQIHLEAADMDMEDLAVEVGKLVQELHTSLARQEPLAAAHFRAAVLITMMPGSPVWNIQEQSEGSSCVMILGQK